MYTIGPVNYLVLIWSPVIVFFSSFFLVLIKEVFLFRGWMTSLLCFVLPDASSPGVGHG